MAEYCFVNEKNQLRESVACPAVVSQLFSWKTSCSVASFVSSCAMPPKQTYEKLLERYSEELARLRLYGDGLFSASLRTDIMALDCTKLKGAKKKAALAWKEAALKKITEVNEARISVCERYASVFNRWVYFIS